MKVLLFTIEYPPFKGGVANYYGNLVANWPEPENILVLNNNENQLIHRWALPKWRPAVCALRRLVRREKPEHIIIGNILPLGTAVLLATRFKKIPYTVILHGMDLMYSQKSWRKRYLAKKILRKAQHVITNSKYVADLAKKIINQPEKIHAVNPGIDMQPPNPKIVEEIKTRHNLENMTIMFSVSRLVKRKGQDKVLECLNEAVKSVPNLYYFIAGDGPDKIYLHEKAKGVKNVVFLGKISDEEKQAWLSICDFFAMPARETEGDLEGFGIVYLEAAIHAKAVLAGESGGVKDAVLGGQTGILVNPLDKRKITDAIIKLASEKETRDLLGRNAQERVLRDFRWEDKIKKIYDIINKVNI